MISGGNRWPLYFVEFIFIRKVWRRQSQLDSTYAAGEKTNYEFEDALIDWDRILGRQHWFDADDAIGDLTFAAILYPKYSVYADLKKLDSGLVPIFVTF